MPTKVLGLFVVGTLARRWEIEVTLTRTPGGGVTAEVSVPSSLLLPVPEVAEPVTAKAPAAPEAPETLEAPEVPADEAPATGPLPAAAAPGSVPADSGPLPRRLPRREGPATDVPPADHARADRPEAPSGSRPLRRRVRGATLRTTEDTGAHQVLRRSVHPADADAVRSALEEFEAGVERAHRDSDTTQETPIPDQRDQNNLPEGAEQ